MNTFRPTVYFLMNDADVYESLHEQLGGHGLASVYYPSFQEFLRYYGVGLEDCILLETNLSGHSCLDIKAHLVSNNYHLPVILIANHGDMSTVVRAIKAGTFDILLEPYTAEQLLQSIQSAMRYGRDLQEQARERELFLTRLRSLTRRESEVLYHMADGKANKVIASELDLSQRTVEIHRANVMKKMQTSSLAQLVRQMTKVFQNELPEDLRVTTDLRQ